jgi:TatD DNase family protein
MDGNISSILRQTFTLFFPSSLKTEENLKTVAALPNDKILIETDCPWCEIRPTHAGYSLISKDNFFTNTVKKEKWKPDCAVKSRNEPANIRYFF